MSGRDPEEVLDHRFRDPALLETALTHASYAHETDGSRGNERLEFLGDAVLDLVVARALYDAHPGWTEGELTRARASLVRKATLARCARDLEIGGLLRLGRTEQLSEGGGKDTILADAFEALLGALYVDGGLDAAARLVHRMLGARIASADRIGPDAKTEFQEWAHAHLRTTPTYETVADSGTEDDEERFLVEVRVADEAWGRGIGRSKRQAEVAAARAALARAPRDG